MEIQKTSGQELASIVSGLRRLSIANGNESHYQKLAEPFLAEMNRRGELIAKRFNKKYRPVGWLNFGRR